MAHDVFISHSSKDKIMADAICAGLEARGIRCWIAPRDILPGKNYAGQLLQAIENCKVFIVVLSENAISSTHILKEVELAIEAGGIIMPFRIQDVPLSDDLKYYLSNVHWLDALTPPLENHINKLADTLERMLESPVAPSKQQFPDQPPPVQPVMEGKKDSTKVSPVPDVKPEKKRRKQNKLLWMAFYTGVVAIGVIAGAITIGNKFANSPKAATATSNEMMVPSLTVTRIPPTQTQIPSTPTQNPPTPTQKLTIGSTKISPIDGMVLMYVPAGDFLMNSPDDLQDYTAYLDAFWVDQTEVTNEMFQKCIVAGVCNNWKPNNYEEKADGKPFYTFSPESKNYPAGIVTRIQAVQYCKWVGRSLPTNEQWEKAARGTDGRRYPWGNVFNCTNGNFDDETQLDKEMVAGAINCDGFPNSSPVGSYPQGKSPYGALDMAGNLWEWVTDSSTKSGILRGGSYTRAEAWPWTTYRYRYPEDWAMPITGFRCVLWDRH